MAFSSPEQFHFFRDPQKQPHQLVWLFFVESTVKIDGFSPSKMPRSGGSKPKPSDNGFGLLARSSRIELCNEMKKLVAGDMSLATSPKGWLKSIFSSSHDFQPTHLPVARSSRIELCNEMKKLVAGDMSLATSPKGWLKSIFSSSHDFQPTHLPAIWPAVRLRRTSVFVCGGSLGGGAIHLPRAFEIPRGGAANGSETKKRHDHRSWRLRRTSVFVCGGSLGGGAIHLPRAFEIPRGGAANGSETKKRHDHRSCLFFGARGGSRTRTPLRALAPEASESTNSTTRANGEAERLSCSVQALYYHIPGQVSSLFLRDPVTFCFAHPPGREYA